MGHKNTAQLIKELEELKSKFDVGDKFYHYKHPDQYYKVIAIGFIEASEEPCIVYMAEYGDKFTWVRTENEFFSKVKPEEGTEVNRFTKLS